MSTLHFLCHKKVLLGAFFITISTTGHYYLYNPYMSKCQHIYTVIAKCVCVCENGLLAIYTK